jgi:4-amino-4-deoxy-L-arabinose transferase-like glycosyltransferase
VEFIIADPPKWYGKYFIGQSLFLIPGVWLGMPWLMHPLLIGVCAWLTYVLGCELLNDKIARIATVLMVLSPMRLYVGGTMMGHASSMFVLLVFALAVVKLVKNPARWRWGLIAGFSLGLACNARPLTALGLAGGIGIAAMVALPWRRLDWRTVVAFCLPLALWTGVFFAYNKALTGDAFLTPFNKWSPNDRLGFGEDVGLEYTLAGDKGHSLRRGLLVDAYFNLDALGPALIGWDRITYLLLLLPIAWSRWRKVGLALSVAWILLALVHVFHVSSGVCMGQPRYWSEAMPEMLFLVAISLTIGGMACRRRDGGRQPVHRSLELDRDLLWIDFRLARHEHQRVSQVAADR